jgi:hypothetical protein
MEKKTYEELVQLHQSGRITWLQFVQESEHADGYRQWCEDHALLPDDDSALLFLEQTEAKMMEQEDPEAYGIYKKALQEPE